MKCGSCGGDNAPALSRCQYCDQPLATRQAVDVAWLGNAGGMVGRGRLQGSAQGGTEAASRLRVAAEGAFAAAVGELGPRASREQLAQAMRARLAIAAPGAPGDELGELTVDTLSTAGPPPPKPSLLPRIACLFLLAALAGCCLLFGLISFMVSFEQGAKADRIEVATVVTPARALAAPGGLVILEAQAATVASAIEVASARLVHVEETERRTTRRQRESTVTVGGKTRTESWSEEETRSDLHARTADGLRIGGVAIASGAEWDALTPLPDLTAEDDGVKRTYLGVVVGAPLTVVGTVHADGTLGKGGDDDPFLISTRASRADVVASLRKQSSEMRLFGAGLLAVALIGAGITAALVVASRRA